MESMSWKISYDDIDFKVGSYGGSIYGSRVSRTAEVVINVCQTYSVTWCRCAVHVLFLM